MKKLLSLIFVIITVLTLAACSKFTCDVCQKEKRGKKHEMKDTGFELTICDDCYKKATN